MPLQAGTRLGPYEIDATIGAGGMGEVYRATDTRLNRTVAVKVLLDPHGADPERRARLLREARAVSSLSHPHICALFDVGEQDGIHYIVMEFLQGETLEQRLERGPIPIEQAVQFAIHIADALDRAHRQGLVHRDLKPGNLMLTSAGVKLLDFGLAKLKQDEGGAVSTQTGMPTHAGTKPLTAQGMILGTLQYMSPEQLEGREADHRSDIFAFGAVLHEMLTSKKAFDGASPASVVGAIMSAEPKAISSYIPTAPAFLDRMIARCLAKDPENRWQSARDLVLELRAAPPDAAAVFHQPPPSRVSRVTMAALAAAAAAIAIAAWALTNRGSSAAPPGSGAPVRFAFEAPADTRFTTAFDIPFAMSPDGRHIVFAAISQSGDRQLWLRSIESEKAQPLHGTESGSMPFWSRDSQWIGFNARGVLKKVPIAGGVAQTIASTMSNTGATWSSDGVILFSTGDETGLSRVSDQGGAVTSVTTLRKDRGESAHDWPKFLDDDRHFIYGSLTRDRSEIYVGSIDGGEPKLLMERSFTGRSSLGYAPGYLLYVEDGALFARPFDEKSLSITGDPIRLQDGIPVTGSGRAPFSVSRAGALAYSTMLSGTPRSLKWASRAGALTDGIGVGRYAGFALAPDGRSLAFSRFDDTGRRDVWVRDLARGTEYKLTFDGDSATPIWSPDGKRVAFASARRNPPNLFTKAAGGGDDERHTDAPQQHYPDSWSADGSMLIYDGLDSQNATDLWVYRFQDKSTTRLPLNSTFDERSGMLSPDGKWIAYESNQSGRNEVWVASFPTGEMRRQVSVSGGRRPRWRGDGRELFYLAPQNLMSVSVADRGADLDLGVPAALFAIEPAEYTVTADGQRFLLAVEAPQAASAPIHVVLNWPALIKRQ